MANTPTTPSSVASRLTDEEILLNASRVDELSYDGEIGSCGGFSCGDNSPNTEKVSAVLRDYVRLRKLNGKLKECLNQAYGDKMNTYRMTGNEVQNWGIVLAEAEKGEAK